MPDKPCDPPAYIYCDGEHEWCREWLEYLVHGHVQVNPRTYPERDRRAGRSRSDRRRK